MGKDTGDESLKTQARVRVRVRARAWHDQPIELEVPEVRGEFHVVTQAVVYVHGGR